MPIALLSDIHGNSPALQAVLADVKRHTCERIFVLGDVSNGIDAQGCFRLLNQQRHIAFVRGNAEAYLLTPNLEALPRQDTPMNRYLLPLVRWHRQHLTPGDLAQISVWPSHIIYKNACLVHDSPLECLFPKNWHDPGLPVPYQEWFHHANGIYRGMPETELAAQFAWMETQQITHVFCGHTHHSLIYEKHGKIICNAGSVGMPADGDPRACWVQWRPELSGAASVTTHRVEYDIRLTQQMIDADPSFLANEGPEVRQAHKQMLATGIHWRVHLPAYATDWRSAYSPPQTNIS